MIWGHLFANTTPDPRTPCWRGSLLGGRTLVIATQTRAELPYGLYSSDWIEARRTRVMARLDDTNGSAGAVRRTCLRSGAQAGQDGVADVREVLQLPRAQRVEHDRPNGLGVARRHLDQPVAPRG